LFKLNSTGDCKSTGERQNRPLGCLQTVHRLTNSHPVNKPDKINGIKMRFNVHQFYDKTYTKLFSHKRMVEDFVKGFIHEDFAQDIEILEKLDTKFVTKKYHKYESDLIYKAKFKDKDIFVFILLEFQTKNDNLIALRLMNYISLFYLNYIKQTKIKPPLPPVLPIVIHIGQDKFTENRNFSDLVNQPYKSLHKYIPNFQYLLVDLQKLSKDTLARLAIHSKNIASMLFEIDLYSEQELALNLNKVVMLLKENLPKELLSDFEEYLTAILSSNETEQKDLIKTLTKEPSMLYNTIQQMREKDEKKGIEKGIKKGIKKGKLEDALMMLKEGIGFDLIKKITGLSEEELNNLRAEK